MNYSNCMRGTGRSVQANSAAIFGRKRIASAKSSKRGGSKWREIILIGLAAMIPVTSVQGDVTGATVVHGNATINQQGATTIINAGNNAIINYQSFNVLAHESVQFVQPGADSRVLNRILGGMPSSIEGNLTANGQVYFVNPAGILFGSGAYINVGGLFAVAGHMADADFLNGRDRFTGLSGDVINAGNIRGDSVYLAGHQVSNLGTIDSPGGLVAMIAGDELLVGEEGGHIFLNVSASGSRSTGVGVENSGTIQAMGGRSILGAGDIYSLAVVNSGNIKAKEILLKAEGGGRVLASGTLDASTDSPGGTGGTVQILGGEIALVATTVDASGPAGGGEVLVGGDYHGEGPVPTAKRTLVYDNVTIKADATSSGDGGKVIIWSDESTSFRGSISARGGDGGGDGGFVEISSGNQLYARGSVDLAAPKGKAGTLLYDPLEIEIRGGATNVDGSDSDSLSTLLQNGGNPPGQVYFNDPWTSGPFVIYQSEIENTDANIVLEAGHSIYTSGIFGNGGLFLADNRNLTLRTRNSPGDQGSGFAGIDLRTTIHTTGTGSILIEAGTSGAGDVDIVGLYSGSSVTVRANSGRISLFGSVWAEGDVTLDGSRGITFSGIILSGGDVILNSLSSIDIYNNPSGGALAAVGNITISSAETSLHDEGIQAGGDITFNSPLSLDGPHTISSLSGDVRFRGDVSTVINGESGDASLSINAAGTIFLGPSFGASRQLNRLSFNEATGRANQPLATIVRDEPGDLQIYANTFVMGQNEKLVVTDGSLFLNAYLAATLGDLGASGNMYVYSPDITLNNRQPVPGFRGDLGLDFVAREISFRSDSEGRILGLHDGIEFANPDNQFAAFATSSGQAQVGGFDGAQFRLLTETPLALSDQSGDPFDLVAPVPLTADTAEQGFAAISLPQTTADPEVPLDDFVDPESGTVIAEDLSPLILKEELRRAGVYVRDPNEVELLHALMGTGLYEQLLAKSEKEAADQDYEVVTRRVSKTSLTRVVRAIRSLLGPSEKTVDKADPWVPVNRSIRESYEAFFDTSTASSPAGLREYLERQAAAGEPSAAQTLAYLNQSRRILVEIDTLGLTRKERNIARETTARRLLGDLSQNIEVDIFLQEVEKHGSAPGKAVSEGS